MPIAVHYRETSADVNENTELRKVTRYFSMSGVTLQQGQPLCYDEDANTIAATTVENWAKAQAMAVVCPESSKGYNFAGIVHPNSVGLEGPCWVDIIVPQSGDILDVLVYKPDSDGATVAVGAPLVIAPSSATTATVGHGYFSAFTMATVASNAAWSTAQTAAIVSMVQDALCMCWESIATHTDDTAATRVLQRVKFR